MKDFVTKYAPTLQKAENLYLLIWEKLPHTFGVKGYIVGFNII